MSIKKLFENKNISFLSRTSQKEVGDELESQEYLTEYSKKRDRFIPPVDFSDPANFARFGSAEKYFIDAIDRIYKTYPYDGSLKERIQWELSSSYLDLYIFDNEYPRTNGHVIFSPDSSGNGWGTLVSTIAGYGAPATASYQYIFTKGGPNTSARSQGKDILDNTGDFTDGYANIWDSDLNRESNLSIAGTGSTDGNTVEFWLKKDNFITSQTKKEVIFDLHTTSSLSSSVDYARLRIEMSGHGAGGGGDGETSPFYITYMSGAAGFCTASIGTNITTASIADEAWHHYAFVFENSGSNLRAQLYIDGTHNNTIVGRASNLNADASTATVGYVSGNLVSTIGSLAVAPSGALASMKGYGKLSGSLDDFRFWKVPRTSKEISLQYIEPIGGGVNTDTANTGLGVYYKFNEGITQTASYDETVLDYSGRISNGLFTGYTASTRNTSSAMVESGRTAIEFRDPILYSFHIDVAAYRNVKKEQGREYDYRNNSTIYNTLPAWIIEEDEIKDSSPLKNLTQIIGSYFDTLASNIEALSSLKHVTYPSASHKPHPFTNRLLESVGFDYVPELFADVGALEKYRNRDDDTIFKQKLYDIKNTIYKNIYNNIVYIYKTKGTEKAFRNLIRCFGVDDEIYKLNIYSNNGTYTLRDNYRSVGEVKRFANFNLTGTSGASVYQFSSSLNPEATSYISGSAARGADVAKENAGLAITMETEVVFPKRLGIDEYHTVRSGSTDQVLNGYPALITASLFGMHSADPYLGENDLTWDDNDYQTDYANFQVHAIKEDEYSNRCYFLLTGSPGGFFPELTSSYYSDVFEDEKWNFSVVVRPDRHPQATLPSGSDDDYKVEFYGVQNTLDITENEFLLTASLNNTNGKLFMTSPKRVYIGAHRTNFTGTLLQNSDASISSVKVWMSALATGTIKQHATDVKNYGTPHPYRSAYLYQNSLTGNFIPEIHTLALNWTFDNVTASNGSGQFSVEDFSSGSTSLNNRYGWIGDIIGKQYTGRGDNFVANFSGSINKKYMYSAKKQLPETMASSDMVVIRSSDDDQIYMRDTRPVNYYLSFEKSMYQTISEEIIRIFSTVKDFNNLIGEPVNYYRPNYKHLEKLRQLFFERVGNTPDLDKYVEYYKWLDAALNVMLGYLIPASSNIDDNDTIIKTMVESHILERNKYHAKYPTFEDRSTDPEGRVLGLGELLYNWKFGHAPAPPRKASAEDALKITGGTVQHNDAFTVEVPENAGGYAGPITITVLARNSMGSTPSANQIHWYLDPAGDSAKIANLKLVFNGTTDTAKVKFGSSFTDTIGVKGLTASDGVTTTDSFASLTADVAGENGNSIAITDTVGTVLVNESALNGGKLANGRAVGAENCLWWKKRAERDDTEAASGVSSVDTDRQRLLSVITTEVSATAPSFASTSSTGITSYSGSTYAIRNFMRPARLKINEVKTLRGGINFNRNKKSDYVTPLFRLFESNDEWAPGIKTLSTSFESSSCDDDSVLNLKPDVSFHVKSPAYSVTGFNELDGTGELVAPFNIVSSSVEQTSLSKVNVVNLHHDTYGYDKEVPMQGPFTEKYVGGKPYRHVWTNLSESRVSKTDTNLAKPVWRPEGWQLINTSTVLSMSAPHFNLGGEIDEGLPRAVFYRDETAKRPVNIRNIQQTTGSNDVNYTVIGNYTKDYEILHSNGRSINNRYLIEVYDGSDGITGSAENSVPTPGLVTYTLPTRAISGSNKSIFVNHFSAPGSPADSAIGMTDFEAAEYSVYSAMPYRNLTVRTALDELYTDHTNQFGFFSDAQNSASYGNPAAVLATAQVRFSGVPTDDQAITIISTDGTSKEYLKQSSTDPESREFGGSNALECAIGLKECIEHSSGHGGKITVQQVEGNARLTLRQAPAIGHMNSDGNTTITEDLSNCDVRSFEGAKDYPGTSGSANSLNYNGSASYHKIHRNTRKSIKYSKQHVGVAGQTMTASTYDNWFVQHPIPQTDIQYAWITASILRADTNQSIAYTGSGLFDYIKPDFSNAGLASTELVFISASELGAMRSLSNDYVLGGQSSQMLFGLFGVGPTDAAKTAFPKASFVPVDFIGLNYVISDPLTAADNQLGTLDIDGWDRDSTSVTYGSDFTYQGGMGGAYGMHLYFTDDDDANARILWSGSAGMLNSILLNRNGVGGWPSWKQVRVGNHKIIRNHRLNNRFSWATSSKMVDSNDGITQLNSRGFASQIEPPITSKYRPISHNLNVKTDDGSTNTTIVHSYGNQLSKFTEKIRGFHDLNNTTTIRFLDSQKKYLIYDSLSYLLLENLGNAANPINNVSTIKVPETIYPREKYTYLKKVRQRDNFLNNFWRDDRLARTKAGSIQPLGLQANHGSPTNRGQNIPNFGRSTDYAGTASIWPLDARVDFLTGACFGPEAPDKAGDDLQFGDGGHGVLQNNWSVWALARLAFAYLSPTYNRRWPEVLTGTLVAETAAPRVVFAGDTLWEAGAQIGVNPFYKNYDSYVEDLKKQGKDYAVVPEFRISEHMDFYIEEKKGDFLAVNTASFSLTGSNISSSAHPDGGANDDFYRTYSNSDFLKYFEVVKDDYAGALKPTKLTLRCKALMKFLPYDGFYPVQRTTDIVSLFWKSYKNNIAVTSSLSEDGETPFTMVRKYPIMARPLFQSLFAPGVLYNTIKSGIAVDYPIMTGAFTATGTTGGVHGVRPDKGSPRINSNFHHRVSFESLIEPEDPKNLGGIWVAGCEPHPSASAGDVTELSASIVGTGKPQYRMAMHNFLAESINFFLPKGKLTTLASAPDNKQRFGVVDTEEKLYMMKLVLSHSEKTVYRDMYNRSIQNKRGGSRIMSSSFRFNKPTLTMYQRTGSDHAYYSKATAPEVYGSSFGPPCHTTGVLNDDDWISGRHDRYPEFPDDRLRTSASFAPFTPPYYGGYSQIVFAFKPDFKGKHSLSDIIANLTASVDDFDAWVTSEVGLRGADARTTVDHPPGITGSSATVNFTDRMKLTSSMNYLQTTNLKYVDYGAQGQVKTVKDDPNSPSQWMIQPKFETPILDFAHADITLPDIGSGSVARGMWHQFGSIPTGSQGLYMHIQDLHPDEMNNRELTGSLADLVGFDKKPKRIGRIAQSKNISEAVVAIPFYIDNQGNEKRFEIHKHVIQVAEMAVDEQFEDYNTKIQAMPHLKPDDSIIDMVRKMRKYVFPPRLDFLTNKEYFADHNSPFAMYIFEFGAKLSQTDLSRIWQNLPPDIGVTAQKREASIPHSIISLADKANLGISMLNNMPDNIQWKVFKVKQRAKTNYYAQTADSRDDSRFKFNFESKSDEQGAIPDYSYNWPYDFFSLVELIKMDAEVEFGKPLTIDQADIGDIEISDLPIGIGL